MGVSHSHITPCTSSEAALRQQASACMVAQRLAVVNRRLRAFCFSPPAPAGGAQLRVGWFSWWLLLGKALACGPGLPLVRLPRSLARLGSVWLARALFRALWFCLVCALFRCARLPHPPFASAPLGAPGLVAAPPVACCPSLCRSRLGALLGCPRPLAVPSSAAAAAVRPLFWLLLWWRLLRGRSFGRRGLGRRRLRAANVRLSCHRLPRRSRTLRAAAAVFHP